MSFTPKLVAGGDAGEAAAFSEPRLADALDAKRREDEKAAEAARRARVAGVDAGLRRPDVARMLTRVPAPLDFVLPGLVAGTAGALVSPGGTGKSFLGLQIAVLVGGGVDTFGDGLAHGGLLAREGWGGLKQGRVAYVSLEDGERMLATRLHAISEAAGLKRDTREARDAVERIAAGVDLIDATGNVADILRDACWMDWFAEQCATHRLVVLDTLRLSHQADENKSGEMAELMARLSSWAARGGAAILFLHHANKDSMREGTGDSQAAARGSSVIIDNARGAFYLQRMAPDEALQLADRSRSNDIVGEARRRFYVKFGVSKANACAPWEPIWLRVDAGGKLTCAPVGSPGAAGGVPKGAPASAGAKAKTKAKAKANSYE